MHNNRFVYEISFGPEGSSLAAPPTEDEVQAQIEWWPEITRSEAETSVILGRFVERIAPELGSDDARVESALLEGGRMRVSLHVPMDEVAVQKLVARHLEELGFIGWQDRDATVIHPFNKLPPCTKFQ